jgi:thiamine-monophosphate kinase
MDEFALIRLLNRPRGSGFGDRPAFGVAVGIGDDAAVLRPTGGTELVATCDMMVETVDFRPDTMRFCDIGYKAMTSNLSDIAAMGAEPRWALVALGAPRTTDVAALEQLYDGLYECAGRYGTAIVGGDTTATEAGLTVTVTVIGEAAAGRSVLRSGARPGDQVFVTGPLGGSAAGLHALLKIGQPAGPLETYPEELQPLVRAHRRPEPRVDAARVLASLEPGVCSSLNDISDGLASEAWEIAEASGVRIVLDGSRIPMTEALKAYASKVGVDPLDWALFGGEDFELVGTAPAERAAELARAFEQAGLAVWWVGEATAAHASGGSLEPGVSLIRGGNPPIPIAKKGYNHFS